MSRRWILVGVALVAGLTALTGYASMEDRGTSSTIPQATSAQLAAAGLDELPLAPRSARVDLDMPEFSNPTEVTNPFFPISALRSAILAGRVDGKQFRTETTLLAHTRFVEWPEGRPVEALVSQYVAYLDGRIEEVALDYYAQADDGSVWYFGEDVFNYADGVIADREGTWLAGREAPAAMIMPADPKVGEVYRPENLPGLVFEEVRVKTVGTTVDGPRGPVEGALVADELHQDGSHELKTFAPGYGEFFTGADGDVEALALAVPADRLAGRVPAGLATLSTGADEAFAHARAKNWPAATATLRRMTAAWATLRIGGVPPRLEPQMGRAVGALTRAIDARDSIRARQAALDVAQSALDLRLRHRPVLEIDQDRLELWATRLTVDAEAGDLANVRGDLATLEWIRDRVAHALGAVQRTRLDTHLLELRGAVGDEELDAVAAEAGRLRATLARL
jgi:hypothetical protein